MSKDEELEKLIENIKTLGVHRVREIAKTLLKDELTRYRLLNGIGNMQIWHNINYIGNNCINIDDTPLVINDLSCLADGWWINNYMFVDFEALEIFYDAWLEERDTTKSP